MTDIHSHHRTPRALPGLLTMAAVLLSACHSIHQDRLDQFEAALGADASATRALEGWCRDYGLATPAVITVEHVPGATRQPTAELRALLHAPSSQTLRYRHVRLRCGQVVMSVAHNWYVPDRLTAKMNQQLDHSDVPFGRIVQPLGFSRERLSTSRIGDPACARGTVLVQRAILRLPKSTPLAMVIECYPRSVLKGRPVQ
jgi:chorismate-pyruvate lyase